MTNPVLLAIDSDKGCCADVNSICAKSEAFGKISTSAQTSASYKRNLIFYTKEQYKISASQS